MHLITAQEVAGLNPAEVTKKIEVKINILLLLAIPLFISCSKEEILKDPILGKWQFRLTTTIGDQFWYNSIILTFKTDGSGTAVYRESDIEEVSNDYEIVQNPCYLNSETGFDWSNLSTDFIAPKQTYKFVNNYNTCSSIDLSEKPIASRTNIEISRFNSNFTEFILDGDVYIKM